MPLTPGTHKGTTAGATGARHALPLSDRRRRQLSRARSASTGSASPPARRTPASPCSLGTCIRTSPSTAPRTVSPATRRCRSTSTRTAGATGLRRRVAAVVLPAGGTYDVVFDSTNAGGRPFTFRYWVNDVTPPKLRVRSTRGSIVVDGDRRGLRRRSELDRGDARREARRNPLRLRHDPHRGDEGTPQPGAHASRTTRRRRTRRTSRRSSPTPRRFAPTLRVR